MHDAGSYLIDERVGSGPWPGAAARTERFASPLDHAPVHIHDTTHFLQPIQLYQVRRARSETIFALTDGIARLAANYF